MAEKKNKLTLDFIVICDYAFQSERGKSGIIGIFDIIGVRNLPGSHPEFFIFSKLKGKEGSEHEIQLKIEDPNGVNVIKKIPIMKVRLSGTGTGNLVQRFLNFPFKKTGEYKISLYEGEKKLGGTKLSIIRVKGNGKTGGESN